MAATTASRELAQPTSESIGRCEKDAEAHVASGRTDLAADLYDSALRLRMRTLGPSHPSLIGAAEVLTRTSNHAASVEMELGSDLGHVERRLKRVLALLAEVSCGLKQARSLAPCFHLTLSNLAALHQRRGNRDLALLCFREAEALAGHLPISDAMATQLSLCALFSQLGRHGEAAKHAVEAMRLGEADILSLSSLANGPSTGAALLKEKASSLAVAYNNLAVQREFLGQMGECLALYEKAVVLAEGYMDPGNPLLVRLRESHRNAMINQANARRCSSPSPSPARLRIKPSSPTPVMQEKRRPFSAKELRLGDKPHRRDRPSQSHRSLDDRCTGNQDVTLSARSLSRELASLLRPPPPGPAVRDTAKGATTGGLSARPASGARGGTGCGDLSRTATPQHVRHLAESGSRQPGSKGAPAVVGSFGDRSDIVVGDTIDFRRNDSSVSGAARRAASVESTAESLGTSTSGETATLDPNDAARRAAIRSGPQRALIRARKVAAAVRIQAAYMHYRARQATLVSRGCGRNTAGAEGVGNDAGHVPKEGLACSFEPEAETPPTGTGGLTATTRPPSLAAAPPLRSSPRAVYQQHAVTT
eukprot:gnl/TRDRNA2_/TRDRNA2_169615_c0_seq1.p1 gnl/TRDRNA2_/TRDRNA2_169615_c0~~gnl/TRDRNA2_/TRDRNA2_169615_c0_seq1.p1  ORF type:complete len:592 (-),score=86.58 gnl/TRDRNA2_/TRDRNA2_169615_c0_seq1:11-1786(-)